MIQITRGHVISAAHRLYEYGGRCERLHGHNYRILVSLTAKKLDELGMVIDFAIVKKVLFGSLDEAWDHRVLLFTEDPLCQELRKILDDDSISPVPFNPTAENMATYLATQFFPKVMEEAGIKNIEVSSVTVFETEQSSAIWSKD